MYFFVDVDVISVLKLVLLVQLILNASLAELPAADDATCAASGAKWPVRFAGVNDELADHGLMGADADGTLLEINKDH